MQSLIQPVKIGAVLTLLTLFFGLTMGVLFGVREDAIKDWIRDGIAQHQQLHDEKSFGKIWRYAQRAHFHAMGLGAATLALILAVAMTGLGAGWKRLTAILIALGGLYPLSWFTMFLLGPSLGRGAAHHHILTELWTYLGVGCLTVGMAILFVHLLTGLGSETEAV